jgi:hypothetical protein
VGSAAEAKAPAAEDVRAIEAKYDEAEERLEYECAVALARLANGGFSQKISISHEIMDTGTPDGLEHGDGADRGSTFGNASASVR